VLKIRQSRLI